MTQETALTPLEVLVRVLSKKKKWWMGSLKSLRCGKGCGCDEYSFEDKAAGLEQAEGSEAGVWGG